MSFHYEYGRSGKIFQTILRARILYVRDPYVGGLEPIHRQSFGLLKQSEGEPRINLKLYREATFEEATSRLRLLARGPFPKLVYRCGSGGAELVHDDGRGQHRKLERLAQRGSSGQG